MNTSRVRGALLAAAQGLALALLSLGVSLTLFILTVLSMAFILLGVGVFTTPLILKLVRAHANQRRLLAADWSGVRIPVPYRPFPADLRSGVTGQVEQCSLLMKDPATWRDMRWLVTDMTGGAIVAFLAPGLFAEGVFGLLLFAGLWKPIGTYWYAFIRVDSQSTAALAALLGCVWITVATYLNPRIVKAHFKIAQASLAPGQGAELTERIDRLTETRHDAVDSSAAELRRIERDLHDGAQARLVSVGMDLGTIEALIEKDPAQAKQLIAQARKSSADALTELRDLVRGIHPPVLAERGVGDAVKALALRLPVPTEVTVDLSGRPDAPVESAAYFAISEVLTNAVKHAGAERIWVDLHHREGMLRAVVTDDGRGGAVVVPGGGLGGVERRLGTFDGVLAVSSPAGGPTMVTMEIPCALS
ncbi:sensor histidine kinase [Streptomyces triticagri]|uniref:histidine kinase n=1 Tax=Streptomyces triticagri TaxID=2293568 RepID=A0A372M5R5_9ACTN|nr:histidine kinase [Streptomyces triticagri]RFU86268.1 sensor histidine kinase [Streptomyces triticagri]